MATAHGSNYQVIELPNGDFLIITDEIAASDVVRFDYEDGEESSSSSSESSTSVDGESSESSVSSNSSESSLSSLSSNSSLSSLSSDSSISSVSEESSTSSLSSFSSLSSLSSDSSYSSDSSTPQGTICWGHATGVTQEKTKVFVENWLGTGVITGAGDDERLLISSGNSLTSEIWKISGDVQISLNQYVSGGTPDAIEYRTGDSYAACEIASWNNYVGSFSSLGFVQVRLSVT